MFVTGIIAAIGIIFLLLKFGIKNVVKADILVDVGATFFLIWIFAGTFAGMMSGLIAGAIISVFLYIAKKAQPKPPPKPPKPKRNFRFWQRKEVPNEQNI